MIGRFLPVRGRVAKAGPDAWAQLEQHAAEMRKSQAALTTEQALDRAMTAHPRQSRASGRRRGRALRERADQGQPRARHDREAHSCSEPGAQCRAGRRARDADRGKGGATIAMRTRTASGGKVLSVLHGRLDLGRGPACEPRRAPGSLAFHRLRQPDITQGFSGLVRPSVLKLPPSERYGWWSAARGRASPTPPASSWCRRAPPTRRGSSFGRRTTNTRAVSPTAPT
jgi:hypothetical protein